VTVQLDAELAKALFEYARAHYAAREAWDLYIEAQTLEDDCLDRIHQLVPKEED
jgi:hypothetical protein